MAEVIVVYTGLDLEAKVANKYINLRKSAEKRGLEFSLTLADLKKLYKAKRCFYTGILLVDYLGGDNVIENSRSFDRVDNEKGYIPGNVVACGAGINARKGDLTLNDLRAIIKKVL